MKGKKKFGNVTLKDLEAILQSKKSLNIDRDKSPDRLDHLNKLLSVISLSEILSAASHLLDLNSINDLVREVTGKDRDNNLENLSVKDIELIIKKAIESKQYDVATNFARLCYKIEKYLRD